MDFDVNAAKAAGHTDEDIARIQKGIAAARAAGHTDEEIGQYLQSEESAAPVAAAPSSPDEIATDTSGADTSDPYGIGAVKSFAKGVGRGLASIPEPSDVVTAISNIPTRFKNDYNAKINPPVAGPEGWNNPPPLPVELNKNPYSLHIAENYNRDVPADSNHPWAETIGQTAAPAIVEAIGTGGASLIAAPEQITASALARTALANTGRAAATTTGTLAGGKAGELTDQALGGSGETGNLVGSVIGGGIGPGFVPRVVPKTASKIFTDATSPLRVEAVDRVNTLLPPERQIPLTAGLVGSGAARRAEDLTATVPGGGGPVYAAREAQHLGFDTAGQKIAENMRGEPSAPEGINISTMGGGARKAATAADAVAAAKQEALYGPMKAQVGPETVLPDPSILRGALKDQAAAATEGVDLNTPVHFGGLVDANAARPLLSGAPKVADPALEASLQAQLARAQANLAVAKPGSPLHTAASQSVSDLSDAIDANRGPTFQDLIKLGTVSGNRLDPAKDFTKTSLLDTHNAIDEAKKQVALSKGVSPEEFDRINAGYGRLKAQRGDVFAPLRDTSGENESYNQLFAGGSSQNLDRLTALHEHAPDELRRVLADQFEAKFRGKGAGLPPSATTVGPSVKTAPDWWSGLPVKTRQFTAGHESDLGPVRALDNNDDASALATLMRADALRPNRTSPSASRTTINSGNIFHQLPAAAGAFVGQHYLGGLGGALAGAVAPAAGANVFGRLLTNEPLVRRMILERGRGWNEDSNTLARIMAAAAGSQAPPAGSQ